jgi:hypothetical protein
MQVCAYELSGLTQQRDAPAAGAPALRDSDLNEARALLTYATAQLAATILELRSRYGIQQYYVKGPIWPQARGAAPDEAWEPPAGPPAMEVTPVAISYEYMQQLTREAVSIARGRHVDSSLQALFVLGDMALVTYNLPEAQRILSIVALAAADGQVRTLHACMLRASADSMHARAAFQPGVAVAVTKRDSGACRCSTTTWCRSRSHSARSHRSHSGTRPRAGRLRCAACPCLRLTAATRCTCTLRRRMHAKRDSPTRWTRCLARST